MALNEKSRAILQAIAKGQTYEQILVQDLAWTYHDIFQTAAEALKAEQLTELFRSGQSVQDISSILHRQSSAIRSRLAKLNLIVPT